VFLTYDERAVAELSFTVSERKLDENSYINRPGQFYDTFDLTIRFTLAVKLLL